VKIVAWKALTMFTIFTWAIAGVCTFTVTSNFMLDNPFYNVCMSFLAIGIFLGMIWIVFVGKYIERSLK